MVMGSSGSKASNNWFSRFIALLLAIGAGVWVYEFNKTLPDYRQELAVEKGTYSGPADTTLDAEGLEALQARGRGQSF